MWDDFDAYTYANFFLCIFYGALLLIGIIMYIVSFKKQFHSTSFILFFVLGVSVRGIAFVLEPFVVKRSLIIPNAVNFFLTTISAFFLFSTYLVLLSLWGETYSDSYGPKDNLPLTSPTAGPITLRKVTFVVNVLLYVVAAILYGLDFTPKGWGMRVIFQWQQLYMSMQFSFLSVLCTLQSLLPFLCMDTLYIRTNSMQEEYLIVQKVKRKL